MSTIRGVGSQFWVRRNSGAWGSQIGNSIGLEGVRVKAIEGLSLDFEEKTDESMNGAVVQNKPIRDLKKVEVSSDGINLCYDDPIWFLIANCIGVASTPTLVATGVYNTYITPINDPTGHIEIGRKDGVVVDVTNNPNGITLIPSCKITEIELSITDTNLTVAFKGLGTTVIRDSANVLMADALEYAEQIASGMILLSQGVVRINDNDDGALDSGDEISTQVKGIKITLKHDYRANKEYGAFGSAYIINPFPDGWRVTNLSLTLNRSTSYQWAVDWEAQTAKKLDVTFTGPLIDATYPYVFKIEFPNVIIAAKPEIDPKDDKAPMPEISFNVLPNNAPTGMTGFTTEYRITLQNTHSVSYTG